jgi:AcrR family transcriptional regulator
MAIAPTTTGQPALRRRDQQKEQTRFDLAIAAYELARAEGLANVRVPQIAEAVGVSTRTFNNYFPSKEAAIVWPTTLRGAQLATNLAERPTNEALPDALVAAVAALYGPQGQDGLPDGWLDGFRALVREEPALHGEYLKAMTVGERALAEAIAVRTGVPADELETMVLATVVVAAERAAVLHWVRHAVAGSSLADSVRAGVHMAVAGVTTA